MAIFEQDNNALSVHQNMAAYLDYAFDWGDWLADGDAIASSTWSSVGDLVLSLAAVNGAVTSVWIEGGQPNTRYVVSNTVVSTSGRRDRRTFALLIASDPTAAVDNAGTALFPDRHAGLVALRADIALGAAEYLPAESLADDDILWRKLVAAEAEAERLLKCFFGAVEVIPDDALRSEIDALEAAGTRYVQEQAFDSEPGMFLPAEFGFLALGHRPVQLVRNVTISMPAPFLSHFSMPPDWIRLNKKYGTLRFYPTNAAATVTVMGSYGIGAMGGGHYPAAIAVRYVAGLKNTASQWPDLIDLVKKLTILNLLQTTFPGASNSISADGLSQSNSIDTDKWQSVIDALMYGPKGSNGGLYTAIHGIVMGVMG